MATGTLWISDKATGDHVLEINGVVDNRGASLTDATVAISAIEDVDGTAVTGLSFPLSGSHISSGNYEVAIGSGINVTAGQSYTAFGTITTSGGKVTPFEYDFRVQRRKA